LTHRRRTHRTRYPLLFDILEDRCLLSVAINVEAAANIHAIDPNIYGTAFASSTQLADLNVPLNRDGGNASDTYSFQQDATNHGSDWFFESIPSGSGNGQGMDSFVSSTRAGGAKASITLNLFDWAAKLGAGRSNLGSFSVTKYGAQQSTDPYNSNWGNGVNVNGTNITGNDPNDAYVANNPATEQAWIQHLMSTFGDSQHGGVQYYTLGNEPSLWNSTHRDIHPAGDTLPELRDRIIQYASMVKSLDPAATILGPEEWGWTNYFISGADAAASNWGATYNGLNAEAWLLDQLRQHDAAAGQRLLDYFTLHFYPQGGQFGNDASTNMELLRNRSTRSLWDANYVDESWIASTGINGGKVNLINLMKNWVSTYYPGTKIGITEYNWGAEGNMNGATTQADVFGIFGREGLNLADRWTTPTTATPTYLAMKLFRNYDGNKSAFGDTSVLTATPNPDQVSAFGALRSGDGALTVMVVNKNLYDPNNPNATTTITINLSNFAGAGVAQEWQLAAINPSDQTQAAITRVQDIGFSGNSLTITLPQQSVELFVVEPMKGSAPATPAGTKATAGNSQVVLSWIASAGAMGYNVYRSTTAGGEGTVPYHTGLTVPTFTDNGLNNGTTYFYKVTAVNASGESQQSVEVSATPVILSGANSTDSFASSTVALGNTDTLTIVVRDGNGNAVTGLANSAFGFTLSGGTSAGTFGSVTATATPGTYTTTFQGTTTGTASTLTATVSGITLASQPTVQVSVAAISGTVFHDYNTNGVQDPGEPGIAEQTVFLDLDGSGVWQSADPSALTDANGNFALAIPGPGTYTVRQLLFGGVLLSAPAGDSYAVTVASGWSIAGPNFADVLTSIAVPLTLPPSLPFPAQGNANADYVEAIYRAVLDRNADLGGLANWTTQLNTGALSRLQVVQGIRNSPEHFTQEVSDFYRTLLNRQPDPSGLQNWVQQLEAGMREEQMAFYFLDSPEYLSQGDKHFVDAMYQSLLGRSFDGAGEATWLSQLGDDPSGNPTHPATLTHEQVIAAFLYSTESETRLTEGYYEVFLQRPADAAGLSSWLGHLQQGAPFLSIGQQFLSSTEFYNRAAQQG
jgi:hypothetical protein